MRRTLAGLLAPFWLMGAAAAAVITLGIAMVEAVRTGWVDAYRLPGSPGVVMLVCVMLGVVALAVTLALVL